MKRRCSMIIIGMLFFLCTDAAGQTMSGTPTPDTGTVQTADETATMTDIHDIKPLLSVPVPVSLKTILLWTAVVLLVAAGLLGAWFLWKRRRAKPIETIEAQLSPEDAAFRKLATLSPETMDAKPFYFQLSAIFREYLQGRFGIEGLEMTTEELLPRVESMPLERGVKQTVKTFLTACDPVKFAGAAARREAMEADLGFVRNFVETTAAPPPTPESPGRPVSAGASE